MNRPILRVAIAVFAMLVVLLANVTYIQVFRAQALRNDDNNRRVTFDEYSRERGMIQTADGQVLARSQEQPGSAYRYQRVYPTVQDVPNSPEIFAPITGYYSLDHNSAGLEDSENQFLSGSDDRLFTQNFADMFAGRDPRGGNVITTIDSDLQLTAFQALSEATNCDGPCRGSVVALEPTSGKILAMVSTPSYDPNALALHDTAKVEEEFNRLQADPAKPITNWAIDERLTPGSTFKVVTTAAALRAGIKPDIKVTSEAVMDLPQSGAPLPNYANEVCARTSSKTVTLEQAFAASCNTAFADLVLNLAKDPRRARVMMIEVVGVSPTLEQLRLSAIHDWADLILSFTPRRENSPQTDRLAAIGLVGAITQLLVDWQTAAVTPISDKNGPDLFTTAGIHQVITEMMVAAHHQIFAA